LNPTKPNVDMSFRKILIAVDSSEYSLAAATSGLELAHKLHAEPALVFVIDKARTIHSLDTGILPEEAIAVLRTEATQTLDQLTGMYPGKEVVRFMPEGKPHQEIIKTAEIWKADLIVLGTHGRTGLKHLLTGSVSEHVLRQSKIPVMIVPLR
jgi:nucleotide-binding universal stress UspA family protein